MYCMNPRIVIETRLAAAEKSSSGTAVNTPAPASRAASRPGSETAVAEGIAGVNCHIAGNAAPIARMATPITPVRSDSSAIPGSAGYPPRFFTVPYIENVIAKANDIHIAPPCAAMKNATPIAARAVASFCPGVKRSLNTTMPQKMFAKGHK